LSVATLYSTDPLIQEKSNGYSYIELSEDGKRVKTRLGGAFSAAAQSVHNEYEREENGYISDLFLEETLTIDGEVFVVFDRRYMEQICNADPSTGIITCTDQYHYNGISFEAPMHTDRSTTIKKRQMEFDAKGEHMGYALLEKDGAAWAFYNDHYRNEGTSAERTLTNISRSVMRFVQVDKNGGQQSGLMSLDRQSGYAFSPRLGMVQNHQHAFFIAKNGSDYRIGKFDFSKLSRLSKGFK